MCARGAGICELARQLAGDGHTQSQHVHHAAQSFGRSTQTDESVSHSESVIRAYHHCECRRCIYGKGRLDPHYQQFRADERLNGLMRSIN